MTRAAFSATHGRRRRTAKTLLRAWLYSCPTNPRCKPPLCWPAKLAVAKPAPRLAWPNFTACRSTRKRWRKAAKRTFGQPWTTAAWLALTMPTARTRWLADALACAATGGSQRRRRLYTNADLVTLRANAWLVVTTANPTFASDAGLADRLLLVRTHRADGDTSDSALSDEIPANRDAGLVHIAETLAAALKDSQPTPTGLNQRHPDFAAFAVRIGRALSREAETVAALQSAEADKSAFCLENDSIGAALLAYLGTAGTFTGTAAELVPHLVATDGDLAERLVGKTAWQTVGRALAALVENPRRRQKRTRPEPLHALHFQATRADFAELRSFKPAFS